MKGIEYAISRARQSYTATLRGVGPYRGIRFAIARRNPMR